jgi:hypothetical protein
MSSIAPTTSTLPAATTTSAMAGCASAPAVPTTTDTSATTAAPTPATAPDFATIIQQLQQVTTQLAGIVAALQGQQQLGTVPAAATPATAPTAAPAIAATTPLTGFTTTGDATAQASLSSALGTIGTTSVGNQLLSSLRNKGVTLDIVDDATFDQKTGGTHKDAAAVAMDSATTTPAVLIRASQVSTQDPAKLRHVLAHELTHAAQYLGNEDISTYANGLGAPANALTADQLKTGGTLMMESGAELVAGLVDAQLQNPAVTANVAKNLPAAQAADWKIVNTAGYNPSGYDLPQLVSPTATALIRTAVGAA